MIERLDKLYLNLETGITRDRYLTMCDQMNTEPNAENLPPSWEDFPDIVIDVVNTFNMLGDRIYPEIGYIGKDYTNLPIYFDLYKVQDKEFFLEILAWLDSRAIKKSSEKLKREYEKLKRKGSGK